MCMYTCVCDDIQSSFKIIYIYIYIRVCVCVCVCVMMCIEL